MLGQLFVCCNDQMFQLPSTSHFVKVLSFLIVASEWDTRQTESICSFGKGVVGKLWWQVYHSQKF
jgi:hypothetical protein